MNKNILKTQTKILRSFLNLFGKQQYSNKIFRENLNRNLRFNTNRYFSTEVREDTNFHFESFRDKISSIYDVTYSEVDNENEITVPKATKGHLINLREIEVELSKFLKALEPAKTYDIKLSKFGEIKKYIPILNKDEVKSSLFSILSDQKIPLRNLTELQAEISEVLKTTQSYESVLDKAYYEKVLKILLEAGKLILTNNVYAVDHTVNLKIELNKDIASKLSDLKPILEFLNFEEVSDDQLITMFPIVIMLNNLYNVTDYVMEKLIGETLKRLLNPQITNFSGKEDLIKGYLIFVIVNNLIKNSNTYLHHMILYKDIILKNKDINDLTYLLTENIYKFINMNRKANSVEIKSHLATFEEFICTYLKSYHLCEVSNRLNINQEVAEKFLYSVLLLSEFNQKLGEDRFLSNETVKLLKKFVENGIYNLEYQNVLSVENIFNIITRDNQLFIHSELENKLFSRIRQENEANNKVLDLFVTKEDLLQNEKRKLSFENLKEFLLFADESSSYTSGTKKYIFF